LVREVIARGYTATITCIEEARAERRWLGRRLTLPLVAEFADRGIDPCGEHGEYHTLVTNGPLFRRPLAVHLGETRAESGFCQLDVRLQPSVGQ
jgi:diphthamide synthase (EF-2-diphthine--ammonia ligase)